MVSAKNVDCEGCGGSLVFDPESQSLVCGNCNRSQAINRKAFIHKKPFSELNEVEVRSSNLVNIKCESCGASQETSAKTLSNTCPFCGSINVKNSSLDKHLLPDAIIPFSVSGKNVSNCFRKWAKGKVFAPSSFRKLAKASQFVGIYTPVWVFDTVVATTYNGILLKEHTRTDSEGRTTRYYEKVRVNGSRRDSFTDTAMAAGEKINQFELDVLQPYNFKAAYAYSDLYLLGFMANSYSKTKEVAFEDAKRNFSRIIERRICSQHNCDLVQHLDKTHIYVDEKCAYALYPVWAGNYKFKNKIYNFYVNGTTGEVTGNSPVSAIKIVFLVLFIILILGFFLAIMFIGMQ